jgi:phosphoribosylaminoimidazole-succinocarboxamide synthase
LIDEALTPDSSRFWALDEYAIGKTPLSFDKQYIRDYLICSGWDSDTTPPKLPEEVISRTRQKYSQIYKVITGNEVQDY